jgi:hypothetical protein
MDRCPRVPRTRAATACAPLVVARIQVATVASFLVFSWWPARAQAGAEENGGLSTEETLLGESPKKATTLAVSRDGLHAAIVKARPFKHMEIVRDGNSTNPRYDDVGAMLFSKDGKHLLVAVKVGKAWSAELDS